MAPIAGDLAIGVDIGGSSMRAGLVDESGTVHRTVVEPTPDAERDVDDVLTAMIEKLTVDVTPVGVGLAVAGLLDRDCRIVRFAPHLPWIDRPVGEILSDRWGIPVLLEHDANSAAWAEFRHGAAAGAEVATVITIGTGIGAALLVDGRIFRGAHGVAPELGHLQVVPDGRSCPCGKRGCLERYCSGTALVDTAVELFDGGGFDSPLGRAVRSNPAGVVGRDVVAAAENGDELGVAVMHRFVEWLAVCLAIAGDVFDPQRIVLCGGMARTAWRYVDDLNDRSRLLLTGGRHRIPAEVRLGVLGEPAGLIGVADLTATRFGVVPRQ